MVRLEGARRDFVRPPITGLRLVQAPGLLANNAEIVQRVGEIRVARTELRFLQVNGFTEALLSGADIAGGCRLFGGIENGLHAHGLGHVRVGPELP